jgi:hypothetical protein
MKQKQLTQNQRLAKIEKVIAHMYMMLDKLYQSIPETNEKNKDSSVAD